MRAFLAATSVPWAIRQESLQQILDISRIPKAERTAEHLEALAAKHGRRLENTRKVTVRDGVAVVPITGPIFRYANLFTAISGAMALSTLATDLREALDNPNVRSLILEIDSPGGEVTGIAEMAVMVRDANAQKPVVAYIDGAGCSAAYWIAAAAGEVVAAPTAMVGSIGCIWAYPKKEDDPYSVEFVSSDAPNKRPDPETDEGRAAVQKTVDDVAEVFMAAVAQYRGVDLETVRNDFGRGGVFVGAAAAEAGLVDRISTFEETLAVLARGKSSRRPGARASLPDAPPGGGDARADAHQEKPMPEPQTPGAPTGQDTPTTPAAENVTPTPAPTTPAAPAPAPAAPAAAVTPEQLQALQETVRRQELELTALTTRHERSAAEAQLSELKFGTDERLRLTPAARTALLDAVMPLGADARGKVLKAVSGLQFVEYGARGFEPTAEEPAAAALSAAEEADLKKMAASTGLAFEQLKTNFLERKAANAKAFAAAQGR